MMMSGDLAGALVAFINPDNNEVVAAGVVQLDGTLNVKVPKGTYKLVVAKSGYQVYEATVDITEDTTINVTLQAQAVEDIEVEWLVGVIEVAGV